LGEEVIKFPDILLDDKLEMAYVGLLHNNPKAISTFYIESANGTHFFVDQSIFFFTECVFYDIILKTWPKTIDKMSLL